MSEELLEIVLSRGANFSDQSASWGCNRSAGHGYWEIYGGLNGVQGILQEQLIDLASESQQNIRGCVTPGALGTNASN